MFKKIELGKTGIVTNKNGFGALPLQRIPESDAIFLLQKAYNNGMHFFDTARAYTNSEERVGKALKQVREDVIIATKTQAVTVEDFWKDLETSLSKLQTDYIDLYQFHNISFCPRPGDESGLYDTMLEAKEQGKIKHIGITAHKLEVAKEAIESDLYETLQFPFSYLATEKDLQVVRMSKEHNMGFIAMKAMAGGLLSSGKAAYAYIDQFDHVLPIWGIQREEELIEFLDCSMVPPTMEDVAEIINNDKNELQGNFCRGCGYCMPCPQDIKINLCARMSLWLRRMPPEPFLTEDFQKVMKKIEDCTECGLCKTKCPYELDIPTLLKENYEDYQNIISGKTRLD